MAFHFSKLPPKESMTTEIQSLNKFSDQQFSDVVALAVSLLLDSAKAVTLQGVLQDFSSTHNVNASALKNVFKSLLEVLNGAVRMNLTPEQLREDMLNLGLNEEKAEYVKTKWKENLAGISKSALSNTLMVNQLVDMEWKFGVTAASSDLKKASSTFLQLKLVVDKGNTTENVHMELTLPQFYTFLHEMEKVKATLEHFT